jgi:catechol 2,3-dioxygenase-like lactoylglutathione lyase family enzyme
MSNSLANADALATIAVKNLDAARKFYKETVGLELMSGNETGTLSFKSGKSKIVVYQSQYAGTNKATSATWVVDDAESVVKELKARGVRFEHYDLPGLTRQGDLHVAGTFKGAWFKDPDGNILHVLSR